MEKLRANPEILKENTKLFLDELAHLGANPILIAMGSATYKILKSIPQLRDYKIIKIMHYAYRYNGYAHNPVKYREKALEQLANV
jgi:hypothetical protein